MPNAGDGSLEATSEHRRQTVNLRFGSNGRYGRNQTYWNRYARPWISPCRRSWTRMHRKIRPKRWLENVNPRIFAAPSKWENL
jgi:hypothetical protein